MSSGLFVPLMMLIIGGVVVPLGGCLFVQQPNGVGGLLALVGSLAGTCIAAIGSVGIKTHPHVGQAAVYLAYIFFIACLLLLALTLYLGLRDQE